MKKQRNCHVNWNIPACVPSGDGTCYFKALPRPTSKRRGSAPKGKTTAKPRMVTVCVTGDDVKVYPGDLSKKRGPKTRKSAPKR